MNRSIHDCCVICKANVVDMLDGANIPEDGCMDRNCRCHWYEDETLYPDGKDGIKEQNLPKKKGKESAHP